MTTLLRKEVPPVRIIKNDISPYQLERAFAETKNAFAILNLYVKMIPDADFAQFFTNNWSETAKRVEPVLRRTVQP